MDRNLALEFVRVTGAAAIEAAKWIGRGDKKKAAGAAVNAMRSRFNQVDFSGTVVIGEGEKDEAPMLYTVEKVGTKKGPVMDLAIDPLECTDSVAYGRYNATTVIASGPKGSLLHAPDTYMKKIAVGPIGKKAIDLEASVKVNVEKVAKAFKKKVEDITVVILDRERHADLIKEVRDVGARVRLITDGDVAAGIATCFPDSGIDLLMGIGGSTEAVLAAVPIKILGGEILCRFKPKDDHHRGLLKKHSLNEKKVYCAEELAKGKDLTFTASGVIDGPLLRGVQTTDHIIITHSLVVRGQTETMRYITTHHRR